MNLHEKCLLKYLQNPDELAYSTEVLKLNNLILEKQYILKMFCNKNELTSTSNCRFSLSNQIFVS